MLTTTEVIVVVVSAILLLMSAASILGYWIYSSRRSSQLHAGNRVSDISASQAVGKLELCELPTIPAPPKSLDRYNPPTTGPSRAPELKYDNLRDVEEGRNGIVPVPQQTVIAPFTDCSDFVCLTRMDRFATCASDSISTTPSPVTPAKNNAVLPSWIVHLNEFDKKHYSSRSFDSLNTIGSISVSSQRDDLSQAFSTTPSTPPLRITKSTSSTSIKASTISNEATDALEAIRLRDENKTSDELMEDLYGMMDFTAAPEPCISMAQPPVEEEAVLPSPSLPAASVPLPSPPLVKAAPLPLTPSVKTAPLSPAPLAKADVEQQPSQVTLAKALGTPSRIPLRSSPATDSRLRLSKENASHYPASIKSINRKKHVLDDRVIGSSAPPSNIPRSALQPLRVNTNKSSGSMLPTHYQVPCPQKQVVTSTPTPAKRGFYVPGTTAASRARTMELPSPVSITKHRGSNFMAGTFSRR